ncbi:alpha/beta fold hydrolase [Orrella sp. NBD-18]|uniref:Alpha/beta fold hydrolase n=1 Tax=Sheuella amnicola TaxID=2707330 RepID=A0A6B2QZA4_9BURK|nr:alpha/beta fold hydrolase [Sheuella amnicola]NDY83058.1 alpha/beta fold hydrolase [Sheuella amnicola]
MHHAKLDTSSCPVPWWLPDRQIQTLYGALAAPTGRLSFIRDRVDTPDGDFLDFDWSAPGLIAQPQAHNANTLTDSTPSGLSHSELIAKTAATRWMSDQDKTVLAQSGPGTQALLLLHGLEGNSASRYAQSIAQHFRARGWVVVVAHFRSCSGFENRLARAYHSGDTQEIGFILDTVRSMVPNATWHAAGISLGGNALLKYLGESGDQSWLAAAAGISVPLDLVAAGNHLSDNFFNRHIYCRHFLRTLKSKVMAKAQRFPGVIDIVRISNARDLRDFDNAYTAPMHGFRDAMDYWHQSSSKPWLAHITTPTLVLNARNDPFLPEPTLPGPKDASPHVLLHQPSSGGHTGFVTGMMPGNLHWLPNRLARFFAEKR